MTTFVFTQAMMSASGVPGVKTPFTPAAFNVPTSSSGMMPPPNTTMSVASCSLSSSMTRANSVICAPERTDSPIASNDTSSLEQGIPPSSTFWYQGSAALTTIPVQLYASLGWWPRELTTAIVPEFTLQLPAWRVET